MKLNFSIPNTIPVHAKVLLPSLDRKDINPSHHEVSEIFFTVPEIFLQPRAHFKVYYKVVQFDLQQKMMTI